MPDRYDLHGCCTGEILVGLTWYLPTGVRRPARKSEAPSPEYEKFIQGIVDTINTHCQRSKNEGNKLLIAITVQSQIDGAEGLRRCGFKCDPEVENSDEARHEDTRLTLWRKEFG